MAKPGWLDYESLIARALRGLVREALEHVAAHGLPPGQELYLTFRTAHPGVDLPDSVRAQYPDEITTVLRARTYDGLVVNPHGFEVSLQFGSLPARVKVPFTALTRFADPTAPFGLDLPAGDAAPEAAADSAPPPSPEPGPAGQDNVVRFGRKPRPKPGAEP